MNLSVQNFFLLTTVLALVRAEPLPFVNEDVEDNALVVVEDDGEAAVERDRRSSLMAQILYDELRLKLKGDQTRGLPTRRVASASVIRKRRSTTPFVHDLLSALTANDGGAVITNELEHNNEVVEDLQGEIRNLERRLMKRSLMAMILKDTLKQRLEDESKSGRHRDIVWGKSTRPYGGNRKAAQHHTTLMQLIPQLSDALEDLEAEQLASSETSPISIIIKPKSAVKSSNTV